MDYQELIERLRKAVISPFDLGPVADAIESLLAENERLNAELAKYRDAPVAAWRTRRETKLYSHWEYRHDELELNDDDWQPLIIKPDENK